MHLRPLVRKGIILAIHFTTLGLDICSSEDMREQVLNCYNELLNETYHNQLQPKSSLCNKHCILI